MATPRDNVINAARKVIGLPYLWGGTGNGGFDCSGLVQWVFQHVGINLPRTAQLQYNVTERLDRSALKPGDLLFFQNTYKNDPNEPITHVGIYIGGDKMINAASEGTGIAVMDAFTGYWGRHYAGAGRPLGFDAVEAPENAPDTPTTPVGTPVATPVVDVDKIRDFLSEFGADVGTRTILGVIGVSLIVLGAYVAVT